MLPEQREAIIKNFVELVRCDVMKLKHKLIDKRVFTPQEISDIFSSGNKRHNRRMLFFNIQDKEEDAFKYLVKSLKEIGEVTLADKLNNKRTGCTPFIRPAGSNSEEEVLSEEEFLPEEELEVPLTPTITENNFNPLLKVDVKLSTEFFDTVEHNNKLHFYKTRSKNRGRVLIINNYEFKAHDYRTGATVDEVNLCDLFQQIGFDIELHSNQTAQEMRTIINTFSKVDTGKEWDICFVIIMSHGTEIANKTFVLGTDEIPVSVGEIQEKFNNANCRLFRGKPKVFLYQACRGSDNDYTTSNNTKHDGPQHFTFDQAKVVVETSRTNEDMLIGYSTLQGKKAHRDTVRGTWYIEVICRVFMKHAHNHPVVGLLQIVDQKFRNRMSEKYTMQTTETINNGFNQCYLHPGIYMDSKGRIKKINE